MMIERIGMEMYHIRIVNIFWKKNKNSFGSAKARGPMLRRSLTKRYEAVKCMDPSEMLLILLITHDPNTTETRRNRPMHRGRRLT